MEATTTITQEWFSFIESGEFPCVAGKASLAKQQQQVFVAGHLACPKDDEDILRFIYNFVDDLRNSESLFNSAVVLFEQPFIYDERAFEHLFWQRLQALSDLDAANYAYDSRVSSDTASEKFSFSLKEEAFFIIGLHAAASRTSRRFRCPAIVFNPHRQFEQLRASGQYEKMKNIIRKKDTAVDGSINPMLEDFGTSSEVFQYSGRQLDKSWKCPLNIHHGTTNYNKTA